MGHRPNTASLCTKRLTGLEPGRPWDDDDEDEDEEDEDNEDEDDEADTQEYGSIPASPRLDIRPTIQKTPEGARPTKTKSDAADNNKIRATAIAVETYSPK